jgi:uncharacterized protein (TIGR01777 family)
MKVFVTGGSGLIGRSLIAALLDRGDRVFCLTRTPERTRRVVPAATVCVAGDPTRPGAWQTSAAACDAVVNLVGESIAGGRWTAARKGRLRHSRLETTANVVAAGGGDARRWTLVNASATGYFGDRGDEKLDESSPSGDDFLASLCRDWERTALAAATDRCRVVVLRFGVALARSGGALPKMLPAFRCGCGGPLGSGRQYFPWIHLDDLVRVVVAALDDATLRGAVNTVAPETVRQAEFARRLGAALGRPAFLPVPAPLLRLLLGELADALLSSQRAVPAALTATGFRFAYPTLAGALDALFG